MIIMEADILIKTKYSDSEIMELSKITPMIASIYLGIPVRNIQEGMQNDKLPIGYAYKKNEWDYVIIPENRDL